MRSNCLGSTPAKPLLKGTQLIISADHNSLNWTQNLTKCIGRFAHWRLRHCKFAFYVVHRTGVRHEAADVLSSFQTTDKHGTTLKDDLPLLAIDEKSDNITVLVINFNSEDIKPVNVQEKNRLSHLQRKKN